MDGGQVNRRVAHSISGVHGCGASAAMKVRVDDPALLPDLLRDLSRRIDAVATQIGQDEIEVSLLGSRTTEADAAELEERLRAWGRGARIVRSPNE